MKLLKEKAKSWHMKGIISHIYQIKSWTSYKRPRQLQGFTSMSCYIQKTKSNSRKVHHQPSCFLHTKLYTTSRSPSYTTPRHMKSKDTSHALKGNQAKAHSSMEQGTGFRGNKHWLAGIQVQGWSGPSGKGSAHEGRGTERPRSTNIREWAQRWRCGGEDKEWRKRQHDGEFRGNFKIKQTPSEKPIA